MASTWTLPSTPTGVTATAVAATEVDLSWTNTSANAYGFQILQSNSDGSYGTIGTIYGAYTADSTVTYADQAAPDGTTGTFEVEAIGEGGLSAVSEPSNSVTTPVAAPSGLSVQVASDSQIDLFWTNNSTAATGVQIARSTTGTSGSFTTIATLAPSVSQYADTGLAEGTHYYYQVKAVTASAASAAVPTDAISDAAVDTLTATPASTTEIDLSWNLNTIGAASIEVDRSADGGTTWSIVSNDSSGNPTLGGTATTFADTSLSENTTYTYRVRAVYPGGSDSAYTASVTAATLGAISGLTATPDSTDRASQIDLAWTLNIDPTTVTSIEIARSTSATGTFTEVGTVSDAATTSTFNDTALAESTDYFYQVHAITTSGTSEEVASTDATTAAVVDTLTATAASTGEIDLSWNLNVDLTTVSGYVIQRSADEGASWTTLSNTLTGADTTFADTDPTLQDNTDYTYQVCAVRDGMNSEYCASTDAVTIAAVSGLTATAVSTSEIDLAWTTNVTGQSGFDIFRSSNGTDFSAYATAGASATSYHDTALAEGMTYWYEVRAYTLDVGNTNFSDPAEGSTEPIQNLNAAPTTSSEVLTWTNLSTTATAVNVYRSTDGTDFSLVQTLSGSTTTWTDGSAAQNTQYWYNVEAVEPSGTAYASGALATWTLPAAPSVLTVTNQSPIEVDLSWTNNSDSSTPFYIERSDDGGSTFSIIDMTDPGATTYADTSVTDGTSYVYRVDAVTGDYLNNNPATSTPTAAAPLTAPTGLSAVLNGQTEIDLSWTNNSQTATGYDVYRSTDGLNFTSIGTVAYVDDSFYSDTGLAVATQYFYRVTATDGTGNPSAPSEIATVATAPTLSVSLSVLGQGSASTLTPVVQYAAGSPNPAASGWDITWGDGMSTSSSDPAGPFSHVYADPGVYTVVASTGDDSYTQTLTATVNPSASNLTLSDNATDAGWGRYVTPGATYQLTATVAGDHLLQWVVDWGDGTTEVDSATSDTQNQTSYTQTFTHVYSTEGVMTPHVSAVFPDGILGAPAEPLTVYSDPWSFIGNNEIGVALSGHTFDAGVDGAIALSSLQYGTPTYTINWGDGSATSSVTKEDPDSGTLTVDHTYTQDGTYDVTVTGSDGTSGGNYVDVVTLAPTVTPPEEQIVAAGQSVTITADYSGLAPGANPVAWIIWNGVTEQMTVSGGSSGTLTAEFSNVAITSTPFGPTGSVGVPTGMIYLCDANTYNNVTWNSNPNTTAIVPWPASSAESLSTGQAVSFNVYVWGVIIGDGTNNDVLAASNDGTQNLQPVVVDFPHPDGEALDLTLTTSDATDDDLWATPSPDATVDTPVLGNSVSSYSFSVEPTSDDPDGPMSQVFWVGATHGSTVFNVLQYNISGVENEGESSSDFLAEQAAGAIASTGLQLGGSGGDGGSGSASTDCVNQASDISMTFEAPLDVNGNPILVDNGTGAPLPSSQPSNVPFSPPSPQVTKVDLVYPTVAPAGSFITLATDTARLEFLDSAQTNIILGLPNRSVSFSIGENSPTTVYAEAIGASLTAGDLASSLLFVPGAGIAMNAQAPIFPGWKPPVPPAVVNATSFYCDINPVTNGVIQGNASLNAIINPAAILVSSNPRGSAATSAVIKITSMNGFPAGLNASSLHWEFDSGQQYTGQAAIYSPTADDFPDNTGLSVSVYGLKAGPIRLDVYLRTANGNDVIVETYDAIVVVPRTIYYRVQLVNAAGGLGTGITAAQAAKQISIVNVYLEQIGVQLAPDPNQNLIKSPGFTAQSVNGFPGIFQDQATEATDDIRDFLSRPNDASLLKYLPLLNDDPGVIQIIYSGGETQGKTLGITPMAPPNSNYTVRPSFQLSYRIGANKNVWNKKPMRLFTPTRQNGKAWGVFLFSSNMNPGLINATYGATLAHEMGHIMGLAHRGDGRGLDNIDPTDPNYNLMSYQRKAQDLDLIQAMAIQGSALFAGQAGT